MLGRNHGILLVFSTLRSSPCAVTACVPVCGFTRAKLVQLWLAQQALAATAGATQVSSGKRMCTGSVLVAYYASNLRICPRPR
jgi:hypothetical protein